MNDLRCEDKTMTITSIILGNVAHVTCRPSVLDMELTHSSHSVISDH